MKSRSKPEPTLEPIIFPRADPALLAQFDINSKVCIMNCGPHRDDPRDLKERKFLCQDCWVRQE